MSVVHKPLTQFSLHDIQSLEPAMKIGLLATLTPQGLPHLTMISTLKASSSTRLSFGQFIEGRSKEHLRLNPKAGWLIMTLDKHLWRGKASFTHTVKSGPDYDFYNNTPLFRYNAYFGVHTVYYLDLVEHTGEAPLPMNAVVLAALKTILARRMRGNQAQARALNPWTVGFLNQLDTLKFIGYLGQDGYSQIIPCIQAQAADAQHVLFAAAPYREEIERIPPDTTLALFGLSLKMEDVLLRGRYLGLRRVGGVRCGTLQVDWVYNPMPPVPGQIYPPLPLEAVTEF
jgi:hypothetical protein